MSKPETVIIVQCTRCGKRGELEKDFGLRNMEPGGQVRNQAQCRECRKLPPVKEHK
jgi:hypothetical protein